MNSIGVVFPSIRPPLLPCVICDSNVFHDWEIDWANVCLPSGPKRCTKCVYMSLLFLSFSLFCQSLFFLCECFRVFVCALEKEIVCVSSCVCVAKSVWEMRDGEETMEFSLNVCCFKLNTVKRNLTFSFSSHISHHVNFLSMAVPQLFALFHLHLLI